MNKPVPRVEITSRVTQFNEHFWLVEQAYQNTEGKIVLEKEGDFIAEEKAIAYAERLGIPIWLDGKEITDE